MPKRRAISVVDVDLTDNQIEILKGAYNDLRYAFGSCGYPNSGTFLHVINYGQFQLTEEEFKRFDDVGKDSTS